MVNNKIENKNKKLGDYICFERDEAYLKDIFFVKLK